MAVEEILVCGRCIRNVGIREFITENNSRRRCSFCGRRTSTPLDDVVQFMVERIEEDYEDAAGALPYETAEGGYQGAETYTSWELLSEAIPLDLAPERFDEIFEAIHDRMPDTTWCSRDPFSLSRFEALQYSWEAFCRTVMRTTRFFFLTTKSGPEDREKLTPAEILHEIAELAEGRDLVRDIDRGFVAYRARRQGKGRRLRTAIDLGPPLAHQAISANRMNPPGIPVFYGAADEETAVAETRDGRGSYVVGRFVARKAVRVLDLRRLPELADYFERDTEFHQETNFLRRFAQEAASRVDRDDRNHIAYIPTQVVAEYFRVVRRQEGHAVDGIIWPSATRSGKWSCVLFASQADLVLSPNLLRQLNEEERDLRGDGDGWLELTARRTHKA